MNGQNNPDVSNIHHPRYIKEGKCGDIKREETLNEELNNKVIKLDEEKGETSDNKVINLDKKEEEEDTENLICQSVDKDFLIEKNLVSLTIILGNLQDDLARAKERCTRLCRLTNLQMSSDL